jgi:glycerate kinase
MYPIQATYGILGDGRTAIIEMASASGLTLIPLEQRNPEVTSTYGVGELIRDALRRGCDRFFVGIGGSATNDAGIGMLRALGYRFLDEDGRELAHGGRSLSFVRKIDTTDVPPELSRAGFTVACDVTNPFSGPEGAACVFARQKGADDAMIRRLDEGLRHFARCLIDNGLPDIDSVPGAGAAGGLGGSFLAFLRAVLKPGIHMVLDALRFDDLIRGADIIITGEGKLDRQTLMGKTPVGVLEAGQRQGIPVIAIGGMVEDIELLNEAGFLAVFSIQPGPVALSEAMEPNFALRNIERIVEQVIRLLP